MILAGYASASEKTVSVLVGFSLPPYVIESENSGMELDVIREALAVSGYSTKPVYVPAARIRVNIETGKADAAMTINEDSKVKGYYSDPHIFYQNVAVSLAKNNLRIDSIPDLAGKRIVAWQDAHVYSGDLYAKMSQANPGYVEIPNQAGQVAMLFAGRTDVIVIDINIFHYYRGRMNPNDTRMPYVIHKIFPKIYYKVCFRDKSLCEAFNHGLAQIRKNGTYEKIAQKYIGAN